jgi:outer membrane biosynthesis protein TonB
MSLLANVLANLLAWSGQIAVLTAVGALAALTLSHPRARLVFWQGLLAIGLILPAVEPWTQPPIKAADTVSIETGPAMIRSGAATGFHFRLSSEYVLALLGAGAIMRLLWIGAGLVRLRRHRLAARVTLAPRVPFECGRVSWYVSDTVSGPVTFGWLRPSILLPSRVNVLSDDLREAIACHELIHVRRRDWLFVLGEELVRAALWFHPSIWFVLSRIQLAREQVVDLEVVRLTSDRERYLDALVAVAAQRLQPDVAPAPLFLKRRQLAARVAAVLKETRMSKPRFIASFATVSSAALIAVRLAVWFFPLQSAQIGSAQTNFMDNAGVTVDAGGKLMHRPPVLNTGTAGTVALDATLNDKGEVTDARVISGPDDLRRSALQNVLQWHYATDPAPASPVHITLHFDTVSAAPTAPVAAVAAVPKREPAIVKSIEIQAPSSDIEQRVRAALPVREGNEVLPDAIVKILEAAKQVDEHFTGNMSINWAHEADIHLTLGTPVAAPPTNRAPEGVTLPASAQPALVSPPMVPPQRIKVGGNVQAANLISKVTPAYPVEAKAAHIQGKVRFTAFIGKDGVIERLDLVEGPALLVPAATDAVKQWIYKPTLLNGNPVEVITQIDVNFTLAP